MSGSAAAGRLFSACALLAVLSAQLWAGVIPAYLSPVPGSRYNAQRSSILIGLDHETFRTGNADRDVILVVGELSGVHRGNIEFSDDGRVMIFKPDVPFSPGEAVNVHLAEGAFTSGGVELDTLSFRFEVSSLSERDQQAILKELPNEYSPAPLRSPVLPKSGTVSSPSSAIVVPDDFPHISVLKSDQPSDGTLFFATWLANLTADNIQYDSSGSQYLIACNNNGAPLFYRHVTSMTADFKVQPTGTLTYFDNIRGKFYELDSTYALIDSFACANGYQTDLHELLLLANGHALLLGLEPETINMNLTIPGAYPNANVIGGVIQELDRNKNVVFQWRSFDHFQVT
ncbi:MAG TPA: hypothetical protein VMH23_19900, partial [Bacteroidota bacterium]|nr:hypothetical protein [Bacteroidota bacterium]